MQRKRIGITVGRKCEQSEPESSPCHASAQPFARLLEVIVPAAHPAAAAAEVLLMLWEQQEQNPEQLTPGS